MHATESVATSHPHLFTVEEYMTLETDDRTELIEGVVYDVSPKNEPHSLAVSRLARFLNRGLSDAYSVRIQDPVAVDGWAGKNAPEVDIAVIAEKPYEKTPTSEDALAFIEVSDATYGWDRRRKIPRYVACGVPVWHVNLRARRVEFYDRGAGLDDPKMFTEGENLVIVGVAIPVAALFR